MPCVYGLISFFSYRYFREFTYFELAQTAYEGITISAFLLLLVEMASVRCFDLPALLIIRTLTPLFLLPSGRRPPRRARSSTRSLGRRSWLCP